MQSLTIESFATPEEATNYTAPEYLPITIKKMVVVGKGTKDGKSTIDIIVTDDNGQKYVGMITTTLVENVIRVAKVIEEQ